MTKCHFRLAKKQHEVTVMNQMLDPEDNNIKTKQEDIERILCSYWAHIMRKRNTNCLPAPRTSVAGSQQGGNLEIRSLDTISIVARVGRRKSQTARGPRGQVECYVSRADV